MDDTFLRAYALVRERAGDEWFLLSPQHQVRAVYEEMRLLDAQRAGIEPRPIPPSGVSTRRARRSSQDQS